MAAYKSTAKPEYAQNVQPTIYLINTPSLALVSPTPTPKFNSNCGSRSKFNAGTTKCC